MKYNLSEVTEVIKNRRTIYPEFYSDRKVHKEIVSNVLNNAIWAPTHGLTQPWKFKVFMKDGVEKLTSFIAETYKEITPDFNPLKYQKFVDRKDKCSVIVAVIMERGKKPNIPRLEEINAVSCAIQNMYLTCTAYGLGAFWQTGPVSRSVQVKEYFNIKEEDEFMGFFYMGYPELEEWPKNHRKPIEYKTEWIDG